MGGYILCKYDTILYKGLEHSQGSWNQTSADTTKDCTRKSVPSNSFCQISTLPFNKSWRTTTYKAIYYCNRAFIWRQIPHSSTFLSSFPHPCLQETRGGRKRSPKENLTCKTGPTCFSKVALHLQDKEDFNGSKHLSNYNNRNLINNNKKLILSYQK